MKRVALIAFALAVLGLIAWRAREIDWRAVLGALQALPLTTIALGAVVAAAAHAAFISYDLLARRYTRHPVSMGRTAAIAGVCFAFNLNLGALVGGVALRYRLYSRFGLSASTITRVVGFSLLTNWIGYSALAGAAFASGLVDLPDDVPISDAAFCGASVLSCCWWSPLCGRVSLVKAATLERARTLDRAAACGGWRLCKSPHQSRTGR